MLALLPPRMLLASGTCPLMLRIRDVRGVSKKCSHLGPDNFQIYVQGTPIKGSRFVRYLWVTFQCNGHWTKQVDRAIANARKALNLSCKQLGTNPWGRRGRPSCSWPWVWSEADFCSGLRPFSACPPARYRGLLQWNVQLSDLPSDSPGECHNGECTTKQESSHCGTASRGTPASTSSTQPEYQTPLKRKLEPAFNPTPITNQYHGTVSASQEQCQEAGVCVQDRHRTVKQHGVLKSPWKREPPEVRDHLPGLSKDDSPHLLASRARELLAGFYKQDCHIYTDGSVLEDGSTGAAMNLDAVKTSMTLKLSPSPILIVELTAILAAPQVLDVTKSPSNTVTILSNLRSSLDILSTEYCKSRPELLSIIQGLTSSLKKKKGVSVRYQWVPCQVGLSGNEQADLADKEGAQRVGRPDLTLRPSTSDLVRRVNRAAWSLWAKDYREAALHHNWPMTECQGDSTETLFPRHPPQVGHLMARIRLNFLKGKYTSAKCLCLQENISFQHCLFGWPTLQN